MTHRSGQAALVMFLATGAGCVPTASDSAPARVAIDGGVVSTPGEEHGEWHMPARDYASWRYSSLDQITPENVAGLTMAWSFSTGVLRGHEAAPIVANNTMYIVTPHPNIVYALDLTAPGGTLKWKYEPPVSPAAPGVACCDVVNRGVAYADGRIFFNTLDVQTIALDAETGRELWRVQLGDINRGESMTMAPLVVKGKVLVGNSGGEFGVRGWLTALDAGTGATVWRAYSTGPDAEVLIGEDFAPFYPADREPELGVTTWPPGEWRIGGGTVWGWISYDPELDLIYYGTGNPGGWNPEQRPGDNKWSVSIFARNPDTGMARWAYQFTPHDEHDYDAVNEQLLMDMEINGQLRKVLVRPERNGFMYVMDRVSGEVISAEPYSPMNWATHVDLTTGRPVKVEDKQTGGRMARNVCPAAPGAKDWQPSSFSPRTGWLYIPKNLICMDYEGVEANYIAGTPYVGANVRMFAAEGYGGNRGEVIAWDPVAAERKWVILERFPVWSGTVTTVTDVVFYGTMDRWFKAVHARTGELLWQVQLSSGIIGQPVTYLGPDGKQYVAILAGIGGWAGAAALGILPEEDPSIALGFAIAVKDLPEYTTQGGTLYVFALP